MQCIKDSLQRTSIFQFSGADVDNKGKFERGELKGRNPLQGEHLSAAPTLWPDAISPNAAMLFKEKRNCSITAERRRRRRRRTV